MQIATLTLWEPWASLVIRGFKPTETRAWPPPPSLIGERIGIHAAKRIPSQIHDVPAALEKVCVRRLGEDWYGELQLGCFLGTVELVGAARTQHMAPVNTDDLIAGNWTAGRWAWRLARPERFPEPIPMRGYRKLWTATIG